MSKRFTDSEKFSDIWYRKLPILQKVMYEYLIAECNHAGILEKFDIELMSFKIGADVQKSDFNLLGDRVVFLSENVIYLTKFCKFQYGELNPQNKVHNSVIKELNKWGLQAPTIPLNSSVLGAKDKAKDKNKDNIDTIHTIKEEKEKEEKKLDLYTEIRPRLQQTCKEVYQTSCLISNDDCMRAAELSGTYSDFWETLKTCLEQVKTLDFRGYKPNIRWLLQEKNYTDLRNGVYNKAAPDLNGKSLIELQNMGLSEEQILDYYRSKELG